MRRILQTVSVFSLLCFSFFIGPGFAEDFRIGQTVILQAHKPIGVPVHREPTSSFWKHVPSGSQGTIRHINTATQWLSILLESGEMAWVSPKYVRAHPSHDSSSPSPTPQPTNQEAAVWSSPEQCRQVVKEGGRMASATPSTLRVATWNVRWFPSGQPADQYNRSAEKTDVDWFVCTIIWMNLDVLAIQESLATPEAKQAWDRVLHTLNSTTGDDWRWTPQLCGKPDHHHIGYLWNDSRVSLSNITSLWQFNVKAHSQNDPCAGGLRPGHYAWVQSREKNGADFHLISLHLKSGPTVFAVEDRHNAVNQLDKTVAPFLEKDKDVVVLGDFNTMGAGDWTSMKYELKSIYRKVASEKPGFKDLPLIPQCTQYFRGRGGKLDHILVVKGMTEIPALSGQVTGYCALADCRRIRGDYPVAYQRLSDHCPVILEIQNQDKDE